jgi:aryl-alcohol dehydrogenase-like predicted oxidoreductase
MVWSPLAGGLLSGKYERQQKAGEQKAGEQQTGGQQAEAGSRRIAFDFPPVNKDRAFDVIDAMRPIAQDKGVSVAQIALAWLLHQPQVSSVIVGARKPEQLADNIGAAAVSLSAEELARIGEVSRLPDEYPGWMLERQGEHRRRQLEGAQRRL